ncbi:hypothetical protein LTR04_006100 [Oleoguttula sp. CCFEE 6159]|nr:hypothetical protein LTR04_006100 [Oleoguttula sp. CCFEE 6159]
MPPKRSRSPTSPSPSQIYRSTPIEDRSSTFIAYYSPSLPVKTLETHPDFESASHRIAAWRKPSTQSALLPNSQRLYDVSHRDDGERNAGQRLAKVLVEMQVTGAVVVARWYGGIMLGPIRFNHIENCARQAVGMWMEESRAESDAAAKKRKVEEDERDRVRLPRVLVERDQSIPVLRKLLAEKKQGPARSGDEEDADASVQPASPAPKIKYDAMPVARLRQLEKARDATIAWLLKEIDSAEEQQRSSQPDGQGVSQAGSDPG